MSRGHANLIEITLGVRGQNSGHLSDGFSIQSEFCMAIEKLLYRGNKNLAAVQEVIWQFWIGYAGRNLRDPLIFRLKFVS